MAKKILLTGGIGSGKSAVADIFKKMGHCVYDADLFAREILFFPQIEDKIRKTFGDQAFLAKGVLDRNYLRELIFKETSLKEELESITHPAIQDLFSKKVSLIDGEIGENVWIFYEASLVLEKGNRHYFDACILVTSTLEIKKKRLKEKRKMEEALIMSIMGQQMSDQEKAKYADYVIVNNSDEEDLKKSAFEVIQYLFEKFS